MLLHLGLDSYLEWFPSPTHYIVTNNGGEGNGFYDIPITGNLYLGAGTWNLNDLGKSNLKHLAYHIIWNFYTLANQDDTALLNARRARLRAYVKSAKYQHWDIWWQDNPAGTTVFYYPDYAPTTQATPTGFPNNSSVISKQAGAYDLDELSITNWESFLVTWKAGVDASE